MQCPNWDCPERNDLGCCNHTACINPKYNIKLIYSNHTIISNDEYVDYITEATRDSIEQSRAIELAKIGYFYPLTHYKQDNYGSIKTGVFE